jgi:hypothetical protein
MGYTVSTDALRESAKKIRYSGEEAESVDLAGTAGLIAGALPGGECANVAHELGGEWLRDLRSWARDAQEHGGKLDTAAQTYDTQEENVSRWGGLSSWG